MKLLCCDRDVTACDELCARLAAHGIECVVKHDPSASLFEGKGADLDTSRPGLWVADDEQFSAAWNILNEAERPDETPVEE